MKNLIRIFLFFLIFGFSIYPQEINSTFEKLSKDAEIILTGKVIQQKSNWTEDKSSIYTAVTIQVEEYLKGSNENTIVVTHPGGEVGEVGEMYTHMPKFKNDEEILLFAVKNKKENTFKVLHGENGKVTLIKDDVTGEKTTSSSIKISELKKNIQKYISE
jgi:hypothetical protein